MSQISKEGEVGVVPFAQQFMEPILDEDILDMSGRYDENSQQWILDKNGSDSSTLMSGFNPERPPTTCSQMTKVGDKHWTNDSYVDD